MIQMNTIRLKSTGQTLIYPRGHGGTPTTSRGLSPSSRLSPNRGRTRRSPLVFPRGCRSCVAVPGVNKSAQHAWKKCIYTISADLATSSTSDVRRSGASSFASLNLLRHTQTISRVSDLQIPQATLSLSPLSLSPSLRTAPPAASTKYSSSARV